MGSVSEYSAGESARARKIAAKLSKMHLRLFNLRSKGKSMKEISEATGIPSPTVGKRLSEVSHHFAFFRATRRMPQAIEPHQTHRDAAVTIIERHFPSLSGNRKSIAKRAIAVGLTGALPLHHYEIAALAAAVRKVPSAFHAQLHFLLQSGKGRRLS